ncbi:LysE/ArgO family amino acid transporter [Cytobacillus solani]|uniref:Lysine transporter LysE n=1 Tax=Cytobacillus solani TaxID=1637975 RepID=A0A0Q3VSB1_9BACI|nr:LysE/ArgO family amino acid transporter [Cytobacillus solani]KOP78849.1 lysine transporter LysE [Bacillus sp. FJAT-21945]KQL27611.1 lysine transporter LysE [Cytobacillus solani]USK55323.1 LysE/ArgO family amino acid transporter [Cytobacillus solani]
MLEAILHGFILAFGLILPLGVQNVFVFNQGAVQSQFRRVLPVIMTASICDTLLISLAVLGVSVVVLEYIWLKVILLTAGFLFLIYMGFVTWRSKPESNEQTTIVSFTPKKQMVFAMSVSLLNPHAILDTIGVIGTSSLKYAGNEKAAFAVVCIFVSWAWFMGLGVAGRITGKMDKSGRLLMVLNKVSAIVMWGTAVYIGCSLII